MVLNFPSADIYDKCMATITNNHFEDDEITNVITSYSIHYTKLYESFDDSGNLSRDNTFLWGRTSIEGTIGGMEFDISPNSFFQVNNVQTLKLYDVVKEFCSLTGEEVVFDLYCGVGTIGMHVAEGAKKVFGIESVVEAVEDAQKNSYNFV